MADAAPSYPSYKWHVPGKAVSVVLRIGVVDRLAIAVDVACRSLPRRGLEIGGILLGSRRRVRGSTVVEIEDFELLDSEHAVGPSYLLSARDRQDLERLLQRQKIARGVPVVGMFRSHTRKEFAITVEDTDLMAEYFPDPSMVLLLIHAAPHQGLSGGFFIWEGRTIRTKSPYLEFPFRPAALVTAAAALPPTPAEPEMAVVQPEALPQPVRAFNPKHARLAGFAAAGIVGGVLLSGVLQRMPTPPDPAPAKAVRRRTPVAAELTAAPLPVPVAVVEPLPPPPPVTEQYKPIRRAREERSRAVRPATFHIATSAELSATATAISAALPDPPPLGDNVLDSPRAPVTSEALAPPLPKVQDPFVTVSVNSSPERNGGLLGKVFGKRHKDVPFAPPKVVHEPQVTVPPVLRDHLNREVRIDVRAYIDRTGKVEYSEMLSNAAKVNRDLAALAVFAAREYEFSPAQLGGAAAPAEVVLRFRFGPKAP